MEEFKILLQDYNKIFAVLDDYADLAEYQPVIIGDYKYELVDNQLGEYVLEAYEPLHNDHENTYTFKTLIHALYNKTLNFYQEEYEPFEDAEAGLYLETRLKQLDTVLEWLDAK